jgi:hypothetical protein
VYMERASRCERCIDWDKRGLSSTCPSCDAAMLGEYYNSKLERGTMQSIANHEHWKISYIAMKRIDKNTVYVWDGNKTELWAKSPHYAGYAILINKISYEFITSVPNVRYCAECECWEEK